LAVLRLAPLRYEWCRCGALQKLWDAKGNLTRWTYDRQGRLTAKTFADDTVHSYAYDSAGRLASTTDARGHTATFTYAADNRLLRKTFTDGPAAALTPEVQFTYDPVYPRTASMTDGTGTTTFTYHPAGALGALRKAAEHKSGLPGFPSFTATWDYDAAGRLLREAVDGVEATTTYDAAGRPAHFTNPLGTFTPSFDPAGRLTQLAGPVMTTHYTHHGSAQDHRLDAIVHTIGSDPLAAFRYNYNPVGTIATQEVGRSGLAPEVRSFTYDAADQLLAATGTRGGSYTYDPAGNRLSISNSALPTSNYSVNPLNQITSLSTTTGSGSGPALPPPPSNPPPPGTTLKKVSPVLEGVTPIAFNELGQPTRYRAWFGYNNPNPYDVTVPLGNTNKFTPAPTNRGQPTVFVPGRWRFVFSLEFNAGQNLVWSLNGKTSTASQNGPATSGPPTGSTTSVQNATYDADGNMLSLHDASNPSNFAYQYTWDAENRLRSVTRPDPALAWKTTHWDYDGLGRRVRERETDPLGTVLSTKTWVWCGGTQPCEERDGDNQVTQRFFAQGFQRLAPYSSLPASFYYTQDHLGSVREVLDATGTLRARYDYDAWGQRTKLSGDLDADFGYTGHLHHKPTGLILTHYRAYDPRLARWLSRDPIAEAGGINLYGYVSNNPILWIDPLGLQFGPMPFPASPVAGAQFELQKQINQEGKAVVEGLKDASIKVSAVTAAPLVVLAAPEAAPIIAAGARAGGKTVCEVGLRAANKALANPVATTEVAGTVVGAVAESVTGAQLPPGVELTETKAGLWAEIISAVSQFFE
jgi:RHS repeat-associated protein